MSYTVGDKKFDLMSEAIAESAGTGEKVMSGSKTIHTPKEFKMMKNPLFGFGKKSPSKSGFEIAEEVFQSHNGQVDFETFWKEFSPSQPGMRTSEARSIHADLSKQNWRFMRNGSAKKFNYKVIGQNDRVLYDGYSFEKASDLMMKSAAPVRMLRDDVEISKRRPAGDVRRNGMTALRPRHFKEDPRYMVYVGNIGRVHSGLDKSDAVSEYEDYVRESKSKTGRASGEEVTLFENGEILASYKPTSTSIKRNGMTATRHMPDGSKRDTYSVNCGSKSYHTEDLTDAKKKFNSWCRTGDCTLHHGRKLLDSNFEQPAFKPAGLFLHVPSHRPVTRNGSTKPRYTVIVDSVGVVYDGESKRSAMAQYETSAEISRKPTLMFFDGELIAASTQTFAGLPRNDIGVLFGSDLNNEFDSDVILFEIKRAIRAGRKVTKSMLQKLSQSAEMDKAKKVKFGFTNERHREKYIDLIKVLEVAKRNA